MTVIEKFLDTKKASITKFQKNSTIRLCGFQNMKSGKNYQCGNKSQTQSSKRTFKTCPADNKSINSIEYKKSGFKVNQKEEYIHLSKIENIPINLH